MKFIIALILVTMASAASADCSYNGQTYPVGSSLGALVCTAQGWR